MRGISSKQYAEMVEDGDFDSEELVLANIVTEVER